MSHFSSSGWFLSWEDIIVLSAVLIHLKMMVDYEMVIESGFNARRQERN